MNDIKNKVVTVEEFGNTLLFQYPIPVSWAVQQYSSLITTIESQKVEIENKRDLILTSNKMYTEISLRESDLNDEIESLKAITELKNEMLQDAEKRILVAIEARDKLQDITEAAIKGLNEISEYPKGNDLVYVRDIKDKADNTIFEIERLQNAQT